MKVPAEDEYGQPTWPEVLSAEEISRMKSNPDELVKFYTQMQNDPIKTDLADFKAPWLDGQYWEHDKDADGNPGYSYRYKKRKEHGEYDLVTRFVLPADLEMRGVIDPAVSEGGIRKTARTAIVIVGTDKETDSHIIIEAWAKRIGQPRELYNQVFEFHDKYHVRSWGIETFAQQNFILKALREEGVARSKFLPITELPKDVGQNAKDIRIRALQDEFATGKIYIHQMKHTDLIAEYLSFPMGSTKDLLDALGYHKLFWNKPPTGESLLRGKQRSQQFKMGRSGVTGY